MKMEENKRPPENKGKNKIELFFSDMELQSIEDTFSVIKRGGSKFLDKESMVKVLILKDTQLYGMMNRLNKLTPK